MNCKKLLYTTIAIAAATCIGCNSTPVAKNDRMDLSIKPGDDFYNYASGKWIANLPEKPEYSRYNQFDILGEINEERIKGIIADIVKKQPENGTIEQKICDFHALYLDSARLNTEGAQPIQQMLRDIENIKDKKAYFEHCALLQQEGVSGLYVTTGLLADIMKSTENIVMLYQGGLTLSSREYYLEDKESSVKIRNAYADYIRNIFRLAGYDDAQAESRAKAVLDIETQIARENYSNNKLRDDMANYHKISANELKTQYPGVDWLRFYALQGMTGFEYINVAQPEAIQNVTNIISTAKLDDLKSYMLFKVINTAANFLSDDFIAEGFKLSQAITDVKVDRPRWQKAVAEVNSDFGMAVGKYYVEKYFPASSKQAALNLVLNIQSALRDRINNLKWMSPETKAQAIEKLEKFHIKIGYPEEWQDYSPLTIDKSKSLWDNYQAICRYKFKRSIDRKLNKPVDPNEWHMTPQTINAYYNPTTNEITFPAAILQPPFFDPDGDPAANYGGIGCVIGHEMTHGFDDQGRKYDKNGNYNDWWTEADSQEFEKRANVMKTYFGQLDALPGEKVNGEFTLGENIADHGGIRLSFDAFQKFMQKNPLQTINGFTPEQRFYINYGFIWAGRITDKNVRNRIKSDPHSPMHLRVNGQLPHNQSWYDAFGVKKGDKLYLDESDRADIW